MFSPSSKFIKRLPPYLILQVMWLIGHSKPPRPSSSLSMGYFRAALLLLEKNLGIGGVALDVRPCWTGELQFAFRATNDPSKPSLIHRSRGGTHVDWCNRPRHRKSNRNNRTNQVISLTFLNMLSTLHDYTRRLSSVTSIVTHQSNRHARFIVSLSELKRDTIWAPWALRTIREHQFRWFPFSFACARLWDDAWKCNSRLLRVTFFF